MSVETDYDAAVCHLKNRYGSYDDYPLCAHFFKMHGLSQYVEQIRIQQGLSAYLLNIPENVELEMELDAAECPLGFGITAECRLYTEYFKNGRQISSGERPGSSVILSKSDNTYGKAVKRTGTPARALIIAFDRNFIRLMFKDELSGVKPEYAAFFEDNDSFYEKILPASPSLLSAVNSIFSCLYAPPKRELVLKSQILELVIYIFAEYLLPGGDSGGKSTLRSHEIDKVKQVKDYVMDRIETPPSINELAKMSGISESRLKASFKAIFGTTIYGYIQSEKMAKAKIMLETGRHSVSEVAWDIGYTNVSHFIKAFKKIYMVTPGQIMHKTKYDIVRQDIKSVV